MEDNDGGSDGAMTHGERERQLFPCLQQRLSNDKPGKQGEKHANNAAVHYTPGLSRIREE